MNNDNFLLTTSIILSVIIAVTDWKVGIIIFMISITNRYLGDIHQILKDKK